jgi:hypothetical protein
MGFNTGTPALYTLYTVNVCVGIGYTLQDLYLSQNIDLYTDAGSSTMPIRAGILSKY